MRELLLSVVVPTLNEAGALGLLLRDLRRISAAHEVVVADGGSTDGTGAIAEAGGARVVNSPRGRGLQLRSGAAAARAPLLCFLHADVRVDERAAGRLSTLAASPPGAPRAFRLRIDAPGLAYRIVEAGTNLRTRALGLPYGDQGLIVRREEYERVGGHPPIPLMEDVALARALRGPLRPRLLEESLDVSARRWQRDGVLRRTLRNWALLASYLTGTPPERLERHYRPDSAAR